MYAVISSPIFWKEIEQSITSRGEDILLKIIDNDVDIANELQNIGRIAVKYLIIDVSALEDDPKKIVKSLRNYRVMNSQTQIIIIAPNCHPGNELIHSLVTLVQIHDIIAPEGDTGVLAPLIELYDNPSPYKKALKWIIDTDNIEIQSPEISNDKRIGILKDVLRNNVQSKETTQNVSIVRKGLKDTIISWGWCNSGKSFILSNLAIMLARAGAKVALVEGNILNPELFTFFEVENSHEGLATLLRSNNTNILDHAYSPVKNLYVFALLPYTKLETNEIDVVAIQDKLRNSVDFLLIDNPFFIEQNFIDNSKYVTKVLMTVTPNIAKLFTLSKTLERLYNQGVNLGKFAIILNQYLSSKEISLESIEAIINQELSAINPNIELNRASIKIEAIVPPIYPLAYESHTIGKPLSMSQKGEPLTKALATVMNSIWAIENPKKGILSIFKRK